METLTLAPNQEGFSVGRNGGAIQSQLNGVQGRFRRTVLNNARNVSCEWGPLTEDEFQYLKTFYDDRKSEGYAPFLLYAYMDAQEPELHTSCFVPGTFAHSVKGHSFSVRSDLQVSPTPYDVNAELPEWWDCEANAPAGDDTSGGGGENDPWQITIATPSVYFSENNASLDPVTSDPVSGTFNETNVQTVHDYAEDTDDQGAWTWLGSATGFFDAFSVDFEITAGSGTGLDTLAKFGVGRADDQGTTGGSGLYYSDGQIIATDPDDVLDAVEYTFPDPLVVGDVVTFKIGSAVIGSVDVYLNGESIASRSGRFPNFFIRPYNVSGNG